MQKKWRGKEWLIFFLILPFSYGYFILESTDFKFNLNMLLQFTLTSPVLFILLQDWKKGLWTTLCKAIPSRSLFSNEQILQLKVQ